MDLAIFNDAFFKGFLVIASSAVLGLGIYYVQKLLEMWGA